MAYHPLDLLPPEMWDKISSFLCPSNLNAFAHADPYWFYLVEKKRASILPSLVLPIFVDWADENPPGDLATVMNSELLEWRLVSRDWNETILKYLQETVFEDEEFITWKKPTLRDRRRKFGLNWDCLTGSPWNYRRVLHKLLATNPPSRVKFNPVLNHRARFAFPELDTILGWPDSLILEDTMIEVTTDFLEAYGRELISCSFQTESVPLEKIYPSMFRAMNGLENVKIFEWRCDPNGTYWQEGVGQIPRGIPGNPDLNELIRFQPIPTLQHLKEVSLLHLPLQLISSFLQKHGNVEKLRVSSNSGSLAMPVQLKELKKLEIIALNKGQREALESIITQSWMDKVELLKIRGQNFSFSDMINFANKFGSAPLTKLELELNFPNHSVLQDTLNLEKIEELRLSLNSSLDFIRPLKNLRKLEVINSSTNGFNQNLRYEFIQWNNYLRGRDLLKSNIWREFPRLELINVENVKPIKRCFKRGKDGLPFCFQ